MSAKEAVSNEIIKLPSVEEKPVIETVPVFELDGVTYSVPRNPPASVALKYLKIANTDGPDAASYFILNKMLGEETFDTLAEHPSLEKEQFDRIFEIVEKIGLGGSNGSGK